MLESAEEIADQFADERTLPEDWDWNAISDAVFKQFSFRMSTLDENTLDGLNDEGLAQAIYEQAHGAL
jgi:preprotein translocase subunit SecA